MPDYIINFNYTHTYQNIYNNYYTLNEIFYIHGELNHEPNNMVLGIDEYWSEEERDYHTNFTIFKKFAQRIQKNTGVESYKWFEEIKSAYEKGNEVAKVFIFGHSLDVTDKDILYDYLESEATDVTIYCRNEEIEGEYIANVINIAYFICLNPMSFIRFLFCFCDYIIPYICEYVNGFIKKSPIFNLKNQTRFLCILPNNISFVIFNIFFYSFAKNTGCRLAVFRDSLSKFCYQFFWQLSRNPR